MTDSNITPFNGTGALQMNQLDRIQAVEVLSALVKYMRSSVLVKGTDYGEIPGTNNKPTLLLPGMEKLLQALDLRAEYGLLTSREDFDKPLFHYRYECRLYNRENGRLEGSAIGSANSFESKWGFRWVTESQLPDGIDKSKLKTKGGKETEFDFAVDKAETSGQYGKPAEYWQSWKDDIQAGRAVLIDKAFRSGKIGKAWERDSTLYRIENDDVYDQVNTIDKIAQKRALSSAIKTVATVSEYFTVDLEDLPDFNVQISATADVIDGEIVTETTTSTTPEPKGGMSKAEIATFYDVVKQWEYNKDNDALMWEALNAQLDAPISGLSKWPKSFNEALAALVVHASKSDLKQAELLTAGKQEDYWFNVWEIAQQIIQNTTGEVVSEERAKWNKQQTDKVRTFAKSMGFDTAGKVLGMAFDGLWTQYTPDEAMREMKRLATEDKADDAPEQAALLDAPGKDINQYDEVEF